MNLRLSEEEYAALLHRQAIASYSATPKIQKMIDTANTKARTPLEDQEQEALVVWLRQQGIRHHSTPNGGHRHKATAGKLKAQGVVKGVPDITIWPHPNSPWLPILYIEMKRVKNGTVSPEQQEWLDYLDDLAPEYNIRARVCRGFEEARDFITAYGY